MATLEAGATLALANKESMVAGGPFVLDAARRSGSLILPVDSEHSALFQCIAAGGPAGAGERPARDVVTAGPPRALEELLLTGSGGPFRGRTAAELAAVTPERGARAPQLVDGPQDHHRLGHADEQGPRAHRGALPVRRALRAHHRGARPAEHGAQHGAVHRRRDPRAPRRARHAHAHRLGAGVPGAAGAAAGPAAGPVRDRDRLRSGPTRRRSAAWRSPSEAGTKAMLAEREAAAAGAGPAHGRRARSC